jgi:hypothetical protein
MCLSIRAFLQRLFRRPAALTCHGGVWLAGCEELKRRSEGYRESGAFLLGHIVKGTREILEFLYYDDIDETCFANGIVEFDGRKLGRVWKHCRERSLQVVADVHVHPDGFGQSPSDKHNPIIAETGHFALILPHYAAGGVLPGSIGVYEYLGDRRWHDHSRVGKTVFRIGG